MVSRDTRDQIEENIISKVLDTWEGRWLLYKIIMKGDIFDEQQGMMPLDGAAVQRRLGRREMALSIRDELLTIDPDIFIVMQQEMKAFEEDYKVDDEDEEEGELD